MVLHFEVTKEGRKAMVAAIEKEVGVKAKYLGVPSCAYEVGSYTVGRKGELEFDDNDEAAPVIDACVMATGNSPIEWELNTEEPEEESTELTVSIPIENVSVENLGHLLNAKGNLICKALEIEDLQFMVDLEKVSFPWFKDVLPDEAMTYSRFISKICEMTVNQKKITAKAKENENEKYAFRCFLLRLGFIGDEYKTDRKILLKNLNGSSAFKGGAKNEISK